ncbi:unnamed protein product [Tetraodon nigroviridis]|uniref:(spotted green pufferfish) hypothetical protein n=1 Tax=Tetraodon nigroviridis TaxID=99883 RepID=Q4RGD6_TETNG|nr:unnamed protein product [Tetraodon nigroviridis]
MVTLMCSSTVCALSDKPAAYIWYKNQEVLYQDWSPWYQELVPSGQADRYSCAIKGLEDFPAPAVKVGAGDKSCLAINYNKSRICALEGSSVNISSEYSSPNYTELKSKYWSKITWNGERETLMKTEEEQKTIYTLTIESVKQNDSAEYRFRVQGDEKSQKPGVILIVTALQVRVFPTTDGQTVTLMCSSTACALSDKPAAYIWYKNQEVLYQDWSPWYQELVSSGEADRYSCAIKGLEDFPAPAAKVGAGDKSCLAINYNKSRICALEGSSVNISSEYSSPNYTELKSKYWSKITWNGERETLMKTEEEQKTIYTLTIESVKQNDSAEYRFRVQGDEKSQKPGVILIVTDVEVKFSPSAEVTEGQSVRLTCSTHCPLTHKNYTWYLNHRLLPEHQNKHLVLDPATSQHAGSYSCSVTDQEHTRSPEKTLKVQSSSSQWREAAAAAAGGAAALLFITLAVIWIVR